MDKKFIWLVYVIIILFITFSLKTVQNLIETDKNNKEKEEIEEYIDKEKSNQIIEVKITRTNEVIAMDVNDYIRGVLPAEMPPSFEMEALKAQAIVARTYLYNKISQNNHIDSDICDNYNHCQAFYTEEKIIEIWKNKGYSEKVIKEYLNKINKATNETTGIVAKYNGECIKAFFHANSGGLTEDSKEIWGGEEIPYLKSVESLGEEEHQYYKTIEKIAKDKTLEILKNNLNIELSDANNLMKILDYTVSNRVKNVEIAGKSIPATTIRSIFGLKSTNFNIEETENEYIFNVTGYGHGIGMSQTGANYYAKNGMKAEDIIRHYYKGVNVEKID